MFPTSNYMNDSFFSDIIYTTTTPHFSKQQEVDAAAPFCFFHQELELQHSDDLLLFQQDHHQHHLQHQQQQTLVLKNINDNNVQQHQDQDQDQEPNSQKIPVKRSSCKRDRHSKINTAQGPRYRRMRLSLKVARDFFDLQDQMGFDKASKTVEWLLLQAKPEIMKIFGIDKINSTSTSTTTATAASSSASDCEAAAVSPVSVPIQEYSGPKDKPKTTRMPRKKTVLFDSVAREYSREKARARARERTREKIKSRIMVEVDGNHELNMTCTTSTSTPLFETGTGGSTDWPEESAGRSHHTDMILQQLLEQESGTSEEMCTDAYESLMMQNHHLYNLISQDQM